MALLTPGIGLIFWMTVTFLIVMFLLTKFAWKPILNSLKERESSIQDALDSADKAREEMSKLQSENEKLLQEARQEREKMLKEAQNTANDIISKAKEEAQQEGDRMIAAAKEAIKNEKAGAMAEVKNLVGTISLDIAGKILQETLSDDKKQKELVSKYLEDIKLN